jgi:acylpyruvate hydrolase
MKIVVFGPERRIGAVSGERIIDLNRAFASYLREQRGDAQAQAHADERVPPRLADFIALGAPAIEDADRATQHVAESGVGLAAIVPDVNSVQLHAPWPGRRIACVGGNYAAHLAGMWAGRPGVTDDLAQITRIAREEGQWGFWKVPDAVSGPEEEIPFPKRTQRFDYEGEVAIVIGKRGKDISADRIDEFVWGVTLFNDWSIRDGGSQGKPVSYNLAKNFDGSASVGPCIIIGELDHRDIDVETRVNGEVRQRYNTSQMIWPFAEVLEYLSRDFTFVPGDVIAGGTSAGTAADRTRGRAPNVRPQDSFLKVNDVVEVSSPQIGMLRNRLVPA